MMFPAAIHDLMQMENT